MCEKASDQSEICRDVFRFPARRRRLQPTNAHRSRLQRRRFEAAGVAPCSAKTPTAKTTNKQEGTTRGKIMSTSSFCLKEQRRPADTRFSHRLTALNNRVSRSGPEKINWSMINNIYIDHLSHLSLFRTFQWGPAESTYLQIAAVPRNEFSLEK